MSAYEMLMAVLALVSAVAGVGCLVIALLNFLKERNQQKKMPPPCADGRGGSL